MTLLNWSVMGIAIFTLVTTAQMIKIQPEWSQASASTYWKPYVPGNAVDGNTLTFFSTFGEHGSKWWRIDLRDSCLVSSVKIVRRENFGHRLKQVSVLTSLTNDTDPAPDSDQWRLCYYMADPGDTDQERQCTQSTEAHYLAVYSDLNDDLNIAEVEVYGYKPNEAGPRNCMVTPVNASCLQVTWSNELAIYQYQCAKDLWQTTSETSVQVCNLRPGKVITCRVRAVISGAYSQQTVNSTQMPCTRPSSPEISANIRIIDSDKKNRININLTWNVAEHYCQSLVGVRILVTSETTQKLEQLFTSMVGSAVVDDLEPFSAYTLTVTATNNLNLSSSTSKNITTPELEPSDPPSGFLVSSLNGSCVLLSWNAPTHPNGVIQGYKCACHLANNWTALIITKDAPATETELTICGLSPLRRMSCSTSAFNSAGFSPNASQLIETDADATMFPDLYVEQLTRHTRSIMWNAMQLGNDSPMISSYRIIIGQLEAEPRMKRLNNQGLESWATYNKSTLTDYNISTELNLTFYITAEINASSSKDNYTLVVGDGKMYNRFWNAPLRAGYDYIISYGIAVLTEDGEMVYRYSNQAEDLAADGASAEATSSPPVPVQKLNTGLIVGVVIGVVLLAVMATLAVIFLFRWRRKRIVHKTKSNPRAAYQESSPGAIDSHLYEVVSCRASSTSLVMLESKKEKHSYMTMNKQSNDVDIRTKTSAIVIQTNVEAKASNGHDSLTCGSHKVSDQEHRSEIVKKPSNLAVNQNNEIAKPNAVVVETDGVGDCNLDCSDVKILEGFLETGQEIMKKQFERLDNLPKGEMNVALLPENKGKSRYKGLYPVDNYRVILDRTSSKGTDYINASHIQGYKREHHFIAAQGPTAETINDFWLMIWQQKVSAVVMVTNLWEDGKKKCEKYWPDPIGSTIQFGELTVKTESEVLWADFVLRTILLTSNKTNSMIQDTQSRLIRQFHYLSWPDHGVPNATNPFVMFCEKVSYQIEAIKSPVLVHCSAGVGRTGTFISLDYLLAQARDQGRVNMFDCLKRLRERRPSMVQTEHIQKTVRSASRTFDAGKITRNKERNHSQTVLPNDLYRVYLTEGHQDYINAIMLDGYRAKGQLIATHFPLTNTVNDFWQMVSEQGSRTIVQLGKPVTSYFPSRNESAEFDFARIRNLQIESDACYRATTLQMGNIYNTEQTIKVFEVDWPDNGTLPRTESLLALLLNVEKWQQQSENSKIIITCVDGVTFCGLVACTFSSLERLKAEQDVDVYNPVLMNRLRRPEFVASLEQYAFIYKILNSYTESFSEYSNFA